MLLSAVVNQGLLVLMLILGQVIDFFGWISFFHRRHT